jgi:hypothetical protein
MDQTSSLVVRPCLPPPDDVHCLHLVAVVPPVHWRVIHRTKVIIMNSLHVVFRTFCAVIQRLGIRNDVGLIMGDANYIRSRRSLGRRVLGALIQYDFLEVIHKTRFKTRCVVLEPDFELDSNISLAAGKLGVAGNP